MWNSFNIIQNINRLTKLYLITWWRHCGCSVLLRHIVRCGWCVVGMVGRFRFELVFTGVIHRRQGFGSGEERLIETGEKISLQKIMVP